MLKNKITENMFMKFSTIAQVKHSATEDREDEVTSSCEKYGKGKTKTCLI